MGPPVEPSCHDLCRAFRNLRSMRSHRIRVHRRAYQKNCRRPKILHGPHRRFQSSKLAHNLARGRQEMVTRVMSGKVTFSALAVTRKCLSAQHVGRIIRCCQLHLSPVDHRVPPIKCRPIRERLRRVGMRSSVLPARSSPINIVAWHTGSHPSILMLKLHREFPHRFFGHLKERPPPIRQTRVTLTESELSIQDLADRQAIHNREVLINPTAADPRHVVRARRARRAPVAHPSMVRRNPTRRLSAPDVFV